jgi:hypothetical protein
MSSGELGLAEDWGTGGLYRIPQEPSEPTDALGLAEEFE